MVFTAFKTFSFSFGSVINRAKKGTGSEGCSRKISDIATEVICASSGWDRRYFSLSILIFRCMHNFISYKVRLLGKTIRYLVSIELDLVFLAKG